MSLYDIVTVTERSVGSDISLTCETEVLSTGFDESRLASSAADGDRRGELRPDLQITISKGIPTAGGMAGGSADAAGALLAINELWELGWGREQLVDLAAQLGSDVPFCANG